MKIFLDSTNINDIRKYDSYGIIDGVTTNPSLIAEAGGSFAAIVSEICNAVKGDVSIEVASNDYEEMIKEGTKILDIAQNVVIKLPMTWDGIKACQYFSSREKKVNMTLCFSVNQALIAGKAGATYISPFIGRLEDAGEDGIGLICDIRNLYDQQAIKTEILAASIRTPEHVSEAALCGADIVTLPVKILSSLMDHPLTTVGLKKFNDDWAKSGMKI